jgi:methionine-rich copper-binding protein CopC
MNTCALSGAVTRGLTVFLAVVTVLWLTAVPAAAHAALASSTPAEDAGLDTAPAEIKLTFTENLEETFFALTVMGPGEKNWARGEPRAHGADLSVAFDQAAPAGQYTVNYRVVSADGHPVTGQYRFELTGPSTTKAAPTNPTSSAAPVADSSNPSSSGGVPAWVVLVAVILVVVAAPAIILGPMRQH